MIVESEPAPPQKPVRSARDLRLSGWGILSSIIVIASYLIWGSPYTVYGSVDILHSSTPQFSGARGQCGADSEFSDIRPGADVIVRDDSDEIVGTGHLGDGEYVNTYGYRTYCQWPFIINGVPRGSSFYKVQISHRTPLTYPADKLANVFIEVSQPVDVNKPDQPQMAPPSPLPGLAEHDRCRLVLPVCGGSWPPAHPSPPGEEARGDRPGG